MKRHAIVTSSLLFLGIATVAGCATHKGPNTFNRSEVGAKQTVSALEGLSQFLRQAADALQQTDESLASSMPAERSASSKPSRDTTKSSSIAAPSRSRLLGKYW